MSSFRRFSSPAASARLWSPAEAQFVSRCKTPRDDLRITRNTTICPGTYYLSDAAEDRLIQVAGSNLTIGLRNVSIVGSDAGYGVMADGVSNVTIDGYSSGRLRGFRSAILLENGNNCSDNQGWGMHLHRSSSNTVLNNVADNIHLEASPWCVTTRRRDVTPPPSW